MRPDLSLKDRLAAERLLAAVREAGSLAGAARALGYSARAVTYQWARWGLAGDAPLRRGLGVLPRDRTPPPARTDPGVPAPAPPSPPDPS